MVLANAIMLLLLDCRVSLMHFHDVARITVKAVELPLKSHYPCSPFGLCIFHDSVGQHGSLWSKFVPSERLKQTV